MTLPYSVQEIYGIRNAAGNRYQGTKRIYSELYRLYNKEAFVSKPEKVIIEDTNSAPDSSGEDAETPEIKLLG